MVEGVIPINVGNSSDGGEAEVGTVVRLDIRVVGTLVILLDVGAEEDKLEGMLDGTRIREGGLVGGDVVGRLVGGDVIGRFVTGGGGLVTGGKKGNSVGRGTGAWVEEIGKKNGGNVGPLIGARVGWTVIDFDGVAVGGLDGAGVGLARTHVEIGLE